ncbi:hypothetical protein FISHEDRAFT_69105 [Fistulina hepatica ATCC 64428]|uniref:Uncharacterized protein n=1 Tax=Fistulina hepatica ATCC 64428 TaxID=1128425 RepID=A0A0D7APL8_9AGAR|nr:hypothetical protein FISHEDRAFT_69105 [Fistulina hepatica ATCC 64428]
MDTRAEHRPFSQLSRLANLGFGSHPPSIAQGTIDEDAASWHQYIPYNGPIEVPPERKAQRDSWGNPIVRGSPQIANARTQSVFSSCDRPVFVGAHFDPTVAGGVGESPAPLQPRKTEKPQRRSGLASLFSRSRRSSRAHEHNGHASPEPGSTLLATPIRHSADPGPSTPFINHPYAHAFPSVVRVSQDDDGASSSMYHRPQPANLSNRTAQKESERLQDARLPNPASAATHSITGNNRYVKSLRNSTSAPDLQAASRRNRAPSRPPLPKGLDRWLSAETWCDAMFFPRPRLKMKLDGTSKTSLTASTRETPRIVSPPGSPVENAFDVNPDVSMTSRVLMHSRSIGDLAPNSVAGVRARAVTIDAGAARRPPPIDPGPLRPRPPSLAQDDLVLPSPEPSLTHVLEDGARLSSQRERWQAQATSSVLNRTTRNLSRARSKSLTSQGRPLLSAPPPLPEDDVDGARGYHARQDSNIDFLAARVLLGNQKPISIIVQTENGKQKSDSGHSSRHRSDKRSDSGHSASQSSRYTHTHSTSISKSSRLSKSSGGDSSSRNPSQSKTDSRSHSRNDSWGKVALRTALCGTAGALTPMEEKSEDDRMRSPDSLGRLTSLERALKVNGSRTHLSPALGSDVRGQSSANGHVPAATSPTPSGISDSKIGIAISTPPPDAVGNVAYDHPHPYAQGAYPSQSQRYITARSSSPNRYPVESSNPDVPTVETDKTISLHPYAMGESRPQGVSSLPPPDTLSVPHPYSSQRSSYLSDVRVVPISRADSNVPPAAKLWALSPTSGFAREVLEDELLRYSPFIHDTSSLQAASGDTSPVKATSGGSASTNLDDDQSGVSKEARNSTIILDNVDLGETLASAVSTRKSWARPSQQARGVVLNSDNVLTHVAIPNDNTQSGVGTTEREATPVSGHGRVRRSPVQYDASRPPYVAMHMHYPGPRGGETIQPVNAPTGAYPIAMTTPQNQQDYTSPAFVRQPSDISVASSLTDSNASVSGTGSPPDAPSSGSSPQLFPRRLGIDDDLNDFRDLFYRSPHSNVEPAPSLIQRAPVSPTISSRTWDTRPQSQRTTSGLTSLARQLTQELGELHAAREANDWASQQSNVGDLESRPSGEMQFIISHELSSSPVLDDTTVQSHGPDVKDNLTLPEDIQPSHASSIIDASVEDEPTEVFRLGTVEPVHTPPATASAHRRSFSGQMAFARAEAPSAKQVDSGVPEESPPPSSGLLRTSIRLTRSSYMTTTSTSDSRISGLSDFPVPPSDYAIPEEFAARRAPAHTFVLDAYFRTSEQVDPGSASAGIQTTTSSPLSATRPLNLNIRSGRPLINNASSDQNLSL